MSEQPGEAGAKEAIELPAHGDAAFGALMDALAPEPEDPQGAAGGGTVDAPADADHGGAGATPVAGETGAAGEPAAGDAAPAAQPDAGGQQRPADGDPQQPAATAGDGDRPETWTASAADLAPKFGELSTALEESTQQAYQNQALTEVQEEHAQYFEALKQHPRLLVGQQVPAIGKEGMETLRDAADAREWQEAVKSILVSEINDRAARSMEESADFLTTVHASIDLFKNNSDLVPGTKEFDVELANQFAELAKPYELRHEGKLQGYTIPVQPIIEQLRTRIKAQRDAAAKAAPAAPAAASPASGAQGQQQQTDSSDSTRNAPQAGIASKAGNGSSSEDYSTLFGTIGLPNLQI